MILGIDASRANHTEKTGVEWYAWQLIQSLKKITPEDVRVILYSDVPLQGELADLPANWESRVLRWPPKRLWTQLRLSWEMFRRPPDVLFIPAHVFPVIHPKKTVMTIHDVAAARFPESYNWFERWYSLWSARFAEKHLWRVIVPSNYVKEEILTLVQADRSQPQPIHVIPHGYNELFGTSDAAALATAVQERYNVHQPYILSIGRLETKKNTATLVKAFEQIADKTRAELVLVGKPGYGFAAVQSAVVQSSVKHRIRMLGWIPTEDAASLMSRASLFVFPSVSEGFGMPILEALASGVPVVAAKGSCLEEVGGDICEYVEAGDTKMLANAMRQALSGDSPEKKRVRIERARQFSWNTSAQTTLDLLQVA